VSVRLQRKPKIKSAFLATTRKQICCSCALVVVDNSLFFSETVDVLMASVGADTTTEEEIAQVVGLPVLEA
jgi:hypothetical protein